MYIAIDIGATNIRVAAFKSITKPKILKKQEFKTLNNFEKDLSGIVIAVKKLTQAKIKGIGISAACVFNEKRNKILQYANLPAWKNKNIAKDIKKIFKCETIIENDTACACLSEALFGKIKNSDFIYVIWGSGIGAAQAIRLKKEILIRPLEPGHQIISWQENKKNSCGQKGCLEFYCGGHGIEKYFNKKPENLTKNQWQKVIEFMANGMINLITCCPTKFIVFGGGVALNNVSKITQMKNSVQKRLKILPCPQFIIGSLKDNAGLLGAISLLSGTKKSDYKFFLMK